MNFNEINWAYKIANTFKNNEPWIDDVSKLRGEIFYENGKRPAFRLKNGEFYDRDEFETNSHHILAYHGEKLIGAVRLLPIIPPDYVGITSKVVGKEAFMGILQELFKEKTRLLEINRLVVHRNYQHYSVGMYLCAASWVIAEYLHYLIIANGNINTLKALQIKYLGGVFFPRYPGPYSSEYYNDNEIYLIYIEKKRMSAYFLKKIQTIAPLVPLYLFDSALEVNPLLAEKVALE